MAHVPHSDYSFNLWKDKHSNNTANWIDLFLNEAFKAFVTDILTIFYIQAGRMLR